MANDKKEREKMKLEVKSRKFDGVNSTELTTTVDLAKMINSLFRPVFSDYEGCLVQPVNDGSLTVTLFLKDKGQVNDGSIKAMISSRDMAKENKDSAVARVLSLNNTLSPKKYSLTQDAKDILEDFLIVPFRNGKIQWNNYVTEVNEQNGYQQTIYLQVMNLDLNKILRVIYGDKIEDGSKVVYNANIIKPIGVAINGLEQTFMVNVIQLNVSKLEEVAQKVGVNPTIGNIRMVR